jgi:hypothetical protein
LISCGISAGWAVDLGSSGVFLSGSRTLTITKVKAQREQFDTGHAVLLFDGVSGDLNGTCRLDLMDSANVLESSYPCTWTTAAGKQTFTLTLDPSSVQADLQARAESPSGFNQPVEVAITLDTGKGNVSKRTGRVSVQLHVKGTLQVGSEDKTRRFNLVMRGSGTQVH